jgi:hypothetical protein
MPGLTPAPLRYLGRSAQLADTLADVARRYLNWALPPQHMGLVCCFFKQLTTRDALSASAS